MIKGVDNMTIRDFMRVHNTRTLRRNVVFRFIDADYNIQDVTERIFFDGGDEWDNIVIKWYDKVIEEIYYCYLNGSIMINIEVE